ncbi:MAG: ABC transporter ATP-binding protein, partial [Phycisphaerales bacterium]
QALINDPELLILDEPTSGMDPIATNDVKQVILKLRDRGKTILLTSHLLADVEDVCSRMVILYGGRIRAQGTAEQLLSDSRHTLIRVPRVSEKAIQAIDEALHRTDGVGIEAVSAPRQTLEELFLDIVEKARAEQVATSGAQSGGSIASFLKAEDGASGEELVDSLVKSQDAAPVVQPAARPVSDVTKATTDAGVLQDLMQDKPAPAPVAKPVEPAKPDAAKGQVDLGVIDSLLGDAKKDREGGA